MSTAGAKAPVCCIGPQDGVHVAQNPQIVGMLILCATSSCLILGRHALHEIVVFQVAGGPYQIARCFTQGSSSK